MSKKDKVVNTRSERKKIRKELVREEKKALAKKERRVERRDKLIEMALEKIPQIVKGREALASFTETVLYTTYLIKSMQTEVEKIVNQVNLLTKEIKQVQNSIERSPLNKEIKK